MPSADSSFDESGEVEVEQENPYLRPPSDMDEWDEDGEDITEDEEEAAEIAAADLDDDEINDDIHGDKYDDEDHDDSKFASVTIPFRTRPGMDAGYLPPEPNELRQKIRTAEEQRAPSRGFLGRLFSR